MAGIRHLFTPAVISIATLRWHWSTIHITWRGWIRICFWADDSIRANCIYKLLQYVTHLEQHHRFTWCRCTTLNTIFVTLYACFILAEWNFLFTCFMVCAYNTQSSPYLLLLVPTSSMYFVCGCTELSVLTIIRVCAGCSWHPRVWWGANCTSVC